MRERALVAVAARVLIFAVPFVMVSVKARSEDVAISGGAFRVTMDAATGSLRGLMDLDGGRDQLDGQGATLGLWQLRVRDGDSWLDLDAQKAGQPKIERLDGPRPEMRLVWDGVAAGASGPLRVEAVVRVGEEASLSRWELIISKPADVRLGYVRFPRVPALREREGEVLAVPREMGILSREPRRIARGKNGKGARLSWQYPRPLALQCLAFYGNGGRGFYAGCDDAEGYRKDLSIWGDGAGRMNFEVSHEPEQEAAGTAEFRLPFATLLGTFPGDWTAAAEVYSRRPHAVTFARRGRLARNLSPDWVKDTGLWLWNRGRSPGVLGPAREMRGHLQAPVSILWHWWHNCPYDAGFPEYFPPREGEDAFKSALAAAQKEDVRAILYMNQRLWGTETQSWGEEGAAAHSVKDRQGKTTIEIFNTFMKAPCAPMCIGTRFWRDKYAGLAERALLGLGADGVYMDQTGVLASCHDPLHGHILGPGRYWTDGLAMLTSEIRDRCSRRTPFALGGEFCGEPWIGHLDLTLALSISHDRMGASPDWEPIPFFQAVYHPSTVVFGNMAGLAHPPYDEKWPQELAPANRLTPLDPKFGRHFCLEQARTFVWGMQPMVANFLPSQFSEFPGEMGFVTRLVKTRLAALKYLRDGSWLRPPGLEVPTEEIDVATIGTYTPLKAGKRKYPVALAGAWRASDGDVGIALASIDDGRLGLELPMDVNACGLTGGYAVYKIDHEGRHALGRWESGGPALRVELEPLGICVIELCRRGTDSK